MIKKKYVYDFEVLPSDWFVSFMDIETDEIITFRKQERLELLNFIEQIKDDCLLIGFNNKHFDDYCLKAVKYGVNPYKIVRGVIINKIKPWEVEELKFKKNLPIATLDLLEIHQSLSLKEIEGNFGMKIFETDIDLELSRDLTDEEYKNMLEYNIQDLNATKALYLEKEHVESVFTNKNVLIKEYNLSKLFFKKTKVGVVGEILKCKPFKQDFMLEYKTPSFIKLEEDSIIKEYESQTFYEDTKEFSFNIKLGGIDISLGLGGIHGDRKNYIYECDNDHVIIDDDFASFYPNMMANKDNPELRFCPRTIEGWELLRWFIDLRLQYKKSGDKAMSTALKELINSIYGSSLAKYIPTMYDWAVGRNVCITGQLIICMLIEHISKIPSVEVIQVNTDGIMYKINKAYLEKAQEVRNNFMDVVKIELETKIMNAKVIQKDVNNYILYDKDKNESKVKGKDLNMLGGARYKRNSGKILAEMLYNYFVYNTPINRTLAEAYEKKEWEKFQLIYNRKGANFTETKWGDKTVQKVNRVFPVFGDNYPSLYKVKNGSNHLFPDVPTHCYVWNEDLKDLDMSKIPFDQNYYLDLVKKKIDMWKGE